MHLFVIYIGGTHSKALIELHDMRFVVANTIEETYDTLRNSWWGIPESLHLDAWGKLDYADGYRIEITDQALQQQDPAEQLYFVNLGGYDSEQFTELHNNVFVVAADVVEAKQKALQYAKDWQSPHRDYLYEIENIVALNTLLANESHHHIVLKKDALAKPFSFTCVYTPIGK